MKKLKVLYWSTTGFISLMMLFSAYAYFTSEKVITGFTHLGFPQYFRVELGLAKLIGAIVLLIPATKGMLKEWAYAGFFITFVSALIAHISSGDPAAQWGTIIVFIAVLLASYVSYRRLYTAAKIA